MSEDVEAVDLGFKTLGSLHEDHWGLKALVGEGGWVTLTYLDNEISLGPKQLQSLFKLMGKPTGEQ